MQRVWVSGELAITVDVVDFVDPELADAPDTRERGVRVELRPVSTTRSGTIYASDPTTLGAATCRIDLLESAPGAADRMHWHPEMHDGEPGDRTFDPAMPVDPVGWVRGFLDDLDHSPPERAADEIVAAVADGLARAREPWPRVDHDERGLAVEE